MGWLDKRMQMWMTTVVALFCVPHALGQDATLSESTFDKIEDQFLITQNGLRLTINGKVALTKDDPLKAADFRAGSSVTFPVTTKPPCWANLDKCQAGFTFIISTKFNLLYDDEFVLASSGADKYDSQGILLSYDKRKWVFQAAVRTSTLQWIANAPYHMISKKWHDILLSWSPREGITIVVDGFTTGMQRTSSTIKRVTKTEQLCLGCSYRQRTFKSTFFIRKFAQSDTYYKNLIQAGKLETDKPLPEKSETMVNFEAIADKQIIGKFVKMDFSGNVTLGQNGADTVLIMETPGSFVDISKVGHPCMDDIQTCSSGFTLRIVFTLTSYTNDRKVILSSGVETENLRGLSIYYEEQNKNISVIVKSSTKSWRGQFSYTLDLGTWYTLDVTWSVDWGIELHINNRFVKGDVAEAGHTTAQRAKRYLLGKAPGDSDSRTTSMRVFKMLLWKSIHERLTRTDMELPKLKPIGLTTTSTVTTTSQSTTTALRCPDLKSSLTLKPMADVNGDTVFLCTMSEAQANNIEVQMVFRVHGHSSQWNKVITSPDKEASLATDEMNIQLFNKTIYCTATARFFVRGAQWCSKKINSNFAHVTIRLQMHQQQLVIWEGQSSRAIIVTAPVPPSAFCRPEDNGNCRVEIITAFTTSSNEHKCPYKEIIPQAVLGVGTVGQDNRACGLVLTAENWRKRLKIPIKATLDRTLDGNQERKLRVSLKISSQTMDDTYIRELQTITVKIIENNKNSICSSYNDPHLKTFDAKNYDMHIPGEFVLYKHRELEYEVRALYEACSTRTKVVTCNRAVSVRSGDDVISFTTSQTAGVIVQMYLNGDLTPGTRINRHGSGNKYEVLLPHGTVVTVAHSAGININIYIKPSATDLRKTKGLCGTFNQRTDDDFEFVDIKTFALKWKRTDTMFQGVPAQKQQRAPVYCSCQENHAARCEPNLDAFYCLTQASSAVDITDFLTQQAQKPQIKATRQNTSRVKRALRDFPMADDASGTTISLESGREYCKNFLESSKQVKMCSNYLDANDTQISIDNCASDLAALGNKDWAISHLDRLIDACLTTVTRNVTEWTENKDGTVGPPSELVEILCVMDCGTHGKCEYGACNCKDGWTGAQCNIGVDTQPDVFPAEEACDILTSVSSCHVVGVEGNKFVPTSKLTCVFQFIEISESKIVEVGQPETVDAMYISQYKVICKQPDTGNQARSAFVAISNDGGRTTSVKLYLHVVHKASCQKCDLAEDGRGVTCVKTVDSCQIDGRCYAKYERFENDHCYWCDPGKEQEAWTRSSASECHKDEGGNSKTAIAFIVLCVALAIALIVSIAVIIILKRRTSSKTLRQPKDRADDGTL